MSVASQNPFAYLGNDDDGEEKPVVPVKTVDKATTRTTKRNADPAPPARGHATGSRRGGPSGNEAAFRDRSAGTGPNHARTTEESTRSAPRGGAAARVRGGRGSRHPRDRDDRHSRQAVQGGSEKQAAASWGATEGEAELKDEQAGEAIAKTEQKEAVAEDAAAGEPAEPEDKSVSYADYLVQQAEKKLALEDSIKLRSANEGSKLDKKWQAAKPLEKEEVDYFSATGGKKQREREKKVKQTVDFDPRFVEPERPRGGRGGARGGGRGGRGDRGGERGGQRANFRGGRGGRENAAPINTRDESAFPTLGGK
ncbi:hypothetical protein ACO1O0_001404 [Amphichorda felina]